MKLKDAQGGIKPKAEALVLKSSFYNNPFVGMYFKASDQLALAPSNAPVKVVELVERALGVPTVKLLLSQSNLLGLFSCMNSKGVVVTDLAEKAEVALLKKRGLNILLLEGLSPGNNVVANDKAALVSSRVEKKDLRKIEDCLGVEVFQHFFATPALITSTIATNSGLLTHNEITETELKFLEKIFKVQGSQGTVNNGVPFNSLGAVANSKGAVVGDGTSGFETQRIFNALFG